MKLYIPSKLKVGHQKRTDTYTDKLGFVTYFKNNGETFQNSSFYSWISEGTEVVFENAPTDGFVLNSNVGGGSYGHYYRAEKVRVYDPRGFEVEILVSNLLFLLDYCNSYKGKGLEGKLVYAWSGKTIYLIPIECNDYKESMAFTGLQGKKVKAKELVPGYTYSSKNNEDLIFLGRFNYYFLPHYDSCQRQKDIKENEAGVGKRYVFYTNTKFKIEREVKDVAELKVNSVHPDYESLVRKYMDSSVGSKIVGFKLKPAINLTDRKGNDNGSFYFSFLNSDGSYSCGIKYDGYFLIDENVKIGDDGKVEIKTEKKAAFTQEYTEKNKDTWAYKNMTQGFKTYYGNCVPPERQVIKYEEPNKEVLYAILESGKEYCFYKNQSGYHFHTFYKGAE